MNNELSIFSQNASTTENATGRLGNLGEDLARKFLIAKGFAIVAANFKVQIGRNRNDAAVTGEIDIIGIENGTLCFVEVKTRSSDDWSSPESAVDRNKQRKIIRTARAYRRIFGLQSMPYRFDVVSVVIGTGPRPRIELKRNYFGIRNWQPAFDKL